MRFGPKNPETTSTIRNDSVKARELHFSSAEAGEGGRIRKSLQILTFVIKRVAHLSAVRASCSRGAMSSPHTTTTGPPSRRVPTYMPTAERIRPTARSRDGTKCNIAKLHVSRRKMIFYLCQTQLSSGNSDSHFRFDIRFVSIVSRGIVIWR